MHTSPPKVIIIPSSLYAARSAAAHHSAQLSGPRRRAAPARPRRSSRLLRLRRRSPCASTRKTPRRLYDVRQCAEDACTALGFIDPGDVATMMARMKKALKLGSGPRRGLARCWTLYNLSWAVLALKAAFLMTRTTNVHGAVVWEYLGSTRASKGKRAPRRPCRARCDAKVALHPSPNPTSPRPATARMCLPHTHTGSASCRSGWWGCLTE